MKRDDLMRPMKILNLIDVKVVKYDLKLKMFQLIKNASNDYVLNIKQSVLFNSLIVEKLWLENI